MDAIGVQRAVLVPPNSMIQDAVAYSERQMYLQEKAQAMVGVNVTTRVEVQPHGEEVDE